MSDQNRPIAPGYVQEPVRLAAPEACAFLRQTVQDAERAKNALDVAIVAAREAGLSLAEIAELMGVTKTAAAQRVTRLEQKRTANAR